MPADKPEDTSEKRQDNGAAEFVLAGKYPDGRPKFYRFWSVIGPCATADLDEAERFGSAREAMLSPGYSHWSSFYEPVEVASARSAIQRAGSEQ